MKIITINKKASFRYLFIKTYECGIVLQGSEIKSIVSGKVDITDAYVTFHNNEAFLLNAVIAHNQHQNYFDHEPNRTRKLLLHKNEIHKLILEKQKHDYTVIPTKVYLVNSLVKMEIALAKGKNLIDKKETIKNRDLDRITKTEAKRKNYNYK